MYAGNKTFNSVPKNALRPADGSAKHRLRGVAILGRGVTLILLLLAGLLLHSPSLAARSEGTRVSPGLTNGPNFTIADFDGDRLPDVATVETGTPEAAQTRYLIQFAFGGGRRTGLAVSGPVGGLQIASQDVNGDTFLDLIVSTQLANEPVAVLLNDGRGNFVLADVKTFAPKIWESRVEWSVRMARFEDVEGALASAGWGIIAASVYADTLPSVARVSITAERFYHVSSSRDLRGRAPPEA